MDFVLLFAVLIFIWDALFFSYHFFKNKTHNDSVFEKLEEYYVDIVRRLKVLTDPEKK